MFFGYKRKGHTFSKSENDVPKPKPQFSIPRRPTEKERLKPVVASLVGEFRNVQAELAERYEQAAEELLKDGDLASVAYEKGDYVIIPLENDLVKKYFTGISYANEEHINQLKKAFEKLGISATYVHDTVRIDNLTYGEDEYESFLLHIKVIEFTLYGSEGPYFKSVLG